ncbi:MAG: hypothetical protein R6V86_13840, partial [Spirochaetia bacterium]
EHLTEIPFGRYNVLTREWSAYGNLTEQAILNKDLKFAEVKDVTAEIYGNVYKDPGIIQTGVIGLSEVYVNKSYSDTYVLVDSSEYGWSIDNAGVLHVSGLNYTSSEDVFKVGYYIYNPIKLDHSLEKVDSSLISMKIINGSGYEYDFQTGDYFTSDDGYTIFIDDLYNTAIKSGNFSAHDVIEIQYRAPYTEKLHAHYWRRSARGHR